MPGIVSHKLKVVYWFIPKNACTTMKLHLAKVEGIGYKNNIHDAPFEKIIDFKSYPEYFHFAIVRHPIDRLYSLYKDKLKPSLITNNEYLEGVNRIVFQNNISKFKGDMSFVDFIKSIVSIPYHLGDPHYETQWTQFKPFNVYIMKLENFKVEIDKLRPILKLDNLPIINKTEYNTRWKDELPPSLIHTAVQFYINDFIRFNYE